jgi:hypothetical protein
VSRWGPTDARGEAGGVIANIVAFLLSTIALHRRDFGRRRISRQSLDRDLVRFMRLGLDFTVANGNGDSGGR